MDVAVSVTLPPPLCLFLFASCPERSLATWTSRLSRPAEEREGPVQVGRFWFGGWGGDDRSHGRVGARIGFFVVLSGLLKTPFRWLFAFLLFLDDVIDGWQSVRACLTLSRKRHEGSRMA